MSKLYEDKRTYLKIESRQQSAAILSAALKLHLEGSVLLKPEKSSEQNFILYVPSEQSDAAHISLERNFQIGFKSHEVSVWNEGSGEVEFWRSIPIEEQFAKPILDAIDKKIIPFASASSFSRNEKEDDALQRIVSARAREKS